jgi:serine/threonine-protein kinase
MGTVYLAARADEEFHKRVALKIIRSGADSAEVVRHFRRERQILAGLDHPNIAKLLDGGTTDDGLPYLVMEYIEGEPLIGYCDSRSLPVAERLKLFQSVCAAVQYAHRNLVVHRDIKPANILVATDGAPRLLDFGIAKLLNPELAGETPTATAMVMTPEYASPEQARGARITTATDVYSLGVVLYELLTGRHPYRLASRQPLDVLKAVAEQEPERPSTAVERTEERTGPGDAQPICSSPESLARTREGTPEKLRRRLRGDLDNILMLALRKEPQRRYASVEALSDDVRRHLEGLPVTARKPTAAYRAGKFMRRHVAGVAASVVVLLLLVGFAAAMAVQSARVARERDLAQKERATAQRERETAQRVSAFLVDLFKVSDPGEARGNTITAREVLDKGSEEIGTKLKEQPEVRATFMDTIGKVYVNLGLYDKAIPLLQEALETRGRALGRENAEVAQSLNSLAGLLTLRGDYARAEVLHREALAIRRKLLGNDHSDVARSLSNLAGVLAQQGDYAGAETAQREALAIFRKVLGNQHPDVAMSLNNLAGVLDYNGDYKGAEMLFREALGIWRKSLGNEHPHVAMGMYNLALVLYEQGDYAAAESLHQDALNLNRKMLGDTHSDVAMSMAGLAEAQCRQQKRAEPLAREALAILRSALPGGHPYIAEAENIVGGCVAVSHRYAEAESLLLKTYPVVQTTMGEQSPEARKALERVVALYETWGKPAQAANYRSQLTAMRGRRSSE